jgi:hypothetical protein
MFLIDNKKFLKIFLLSTLFAIFFSYPFDRIQAANLALYPASSDITVGNILSVKVLVDTTGKVINSAEGIIQFPTDLLDVLSISKSSSIFSLWIEEPKISNSEGKVTFNGGLPNPGYTGNKGEIISIVFKTKKQGTATILFSDANVRENDGLGTDILSIKSGSQIVISNPVIISTIVDNQEAIIPGAPKAPVIKSETNPDQNKWYNNSNPIFSWVVPSDVTAVRLQYDKKPIAIPSVVYSASKNEKELSDINDGSYYFHAQFKNSYGWGEVGNYKFNIDTTAPDRFAITQAHPENENDPRPILFFNTKDSLSGIDHYDVKVGNDKFITVLAESVKSNPYTPVTQEFGNKTIIVNAYDKAGNVTTATKDIDIKALDVPTINNYPSEIEEGDSLRLLGKSYPDSTVTVNVKNSEGLEMSQIAKTTLMGDFVMTWSRHLYPDLYTITVQVTDDRGAKSPVSAPYTFSVKQGTINKVGYLVINYLSLFIIVMTSLALIIFIIMYFYHKLTKLRRKVRRAASETENMLRRRFDYLEKEVTGHMDALESAKNKRQLTKEEKDILKTLQNFLCQTEKEVDTKLEQLKKDAE